MTADQDLQDPDFTRHYLLGAAREALDGKDFSTAEHLLQEARRLTPGDTDADRELAECEARLRPPPGPNPDDARPRKAQTSGPQAAARRTARAAAAGGLDGLRRLFAAGAVPARVEQARPPAPPPTEGAYVPIPYLFEVWNHVRAIDEANRAAARGATTAPTPHLLACQGPSGSGKTYTTLAACDRLGCRVTYLAGSQLGGKYEGEPREQIERAYARAAEHYARTGRPGVLLVDDLDTSAAADYAATTNKAILSGTLMNLANYVDPRCPVIVTGNNLGQLYGPIFRLGRARVYTFEPSPDEKAAMCRVWLGSILTEGQTRALVAEYAGQPASLFREVSEWLRRERLLAEFAEHLRRHGSPPAFDAAVPAETSPPTFDDVRLAARRVIDDHALRNFLGPNDAAEGGST